MKETDRASAAMRDRLAELESRLEQMERDRSAAGRSRNLIRGIVPTEASTHFRAAAREQLLGVRALMDHWIKRFDSQDNPRAPREEIQID